jgi:thiamine transporter
LRIFLQCTEFLFLGVVKMQKNKLTIALATLGLGLIGTIYGIISVAIARGDGRISFTYRPPFSSHDIMMMTIQLCSVILCITGISMLWGLKNDTPAATQRVTKTQRLVESGILLALGFVLSIIKIRLVAGGGSITMVSMLPIVILAYKYGPSWGALCGFVHGLLQVIEGGGLAPPTRDFMSFVVVFLLDYALAWAAVGFIAGFVCKFAKNPQISIASGALLGIAGRYLSSTISGMVIWSVWMPEGQNVFLWSAGVNGLVMIPEMLITTVVGFAVLSIPVIRKNITRNNI